ncbi:MAG: alpha/beta hydrolase [Chloroflexi bacterium]|nr:alpha/beta hydrolase [Chloroflexota bacterium]
MLYLSTDSARYAMLRQLCFILLLLTQSVVGAQATIESANCAAQPPATKASCGYVSLPQDYADLAAGRVEIYYTQIHSRGDKPDPLVYLVGGPGSSGTQLLPVSYEKYLRAFADKRDIIIIDQRGTGLSTPSLYCREALFRLGDILESSHQEHAELLLEILTDCQRRLARQGLRFDTFHSENNARDVVNALLALGYERWNLVGVSYGSRLALTMMRDFPQYLRSVILDSVYPPQADIYVDAYYNGERALAVLFEACAASRGCNNRYPNLRATFYHVYAQLNEMPLLVEYKPPDSRLLTIEISGYRLYDWVFSWLYEVDAIRMIPKLVYELSRGRTRSAAPMGALFEQSMASLSLGMHYSVQCQEEYGAAQRDYAELVAAHPHLAGFLAYPVEGPTTLPQLCELWGAAARDDNANQPVRSDVPTLLLSGNYDPITPPDYAEMAAETLSSAYSYVLPHVGHAVLRSDECAVDIAVAFIKQPLTEPDSRCIASAQPMRFR